MVDIAAYFNRVGYDGPATPTLETLKRLHEAHVGAVTFENIHALTKTPYDLSSDGLEEKIVRQKRGGYCFEQNLLFSDVLRELGFDFTFLGGRVWMGNRGNQPRTHAALKVNIDGEPWVADVGFGGIGLLEPLPLKEGVVFDLPLVSFRFDKQGDVWTLQSSWPNPWFDLYGFTLDPQERADYVVANHFIATNPASPFTRLLFMSRVGRDKRVRLLNRQLTVITPEGTEERELASREEAAEAARHLLGMDLDPAIVPLEAPKIG